MFKLKLKQQTKLCDGKNSMLFIAKTWIKNVLFLFEQQYFFSGPSNSDIASSGNQKATFLYK